MFKFEIIKSLLLAWPLGLFVLGVVSLIFYVYDLIRILIIFELFLLANSLTIVAYSAIFSPMLLDQFAGILPIILSTAAADAVIGLGFLILLFRQRGTVRRESIRVLHG